MLSYRHAFHAGNFADVLKHSVLTLVLEYMTRKEKGFYYIDSHSGAGLYALQDAYAQKTGEYKNGIAKLINADDIPEALELYLACVKKINQQAMVSDTSLTHLTDNKLSYYPGSPAFAKAFTRRQDSSHLFELHPSDNQLLQQFAARWNKSHVKQSDGYQGILSLVPPPCRRAVVLIDPPYEIKSDYQQAVATIIKAYKKFATGTYILWYPIVKRALIDQMEQDFVASSVKNVLQIEFCQQADSDEYGMTGTGLFVVNPPWLLAQQVTSYLPYLQQHLALTSTDQQPSYRVKQLIAE